MRGPHDRVFYDTCVFQIAQNQGDVDHIFCSCLLDVARITWLVLFSEQSAAEATLYEYLKEFRLSCAAGGVVYIEVPLAAAKKVQKRRADLKKRLRLLCVLDRDRNQVFAALAEQARIFVFRDFDFDNPKKKAIKRASKDPIGPVADLLRELLMEPMRPAQAVAALLSS